MRSPEKRGRKPGISLNGDRMVESIGGSGQARRTFLLSAMNALAPSLGRAHMARIGSPAKLRPLASPSGPMVPWLECWHVPMLVGAPAPLTI